MARGREETSTSGHSGGHPRAKPSTSSVIASLTMEELKMYCEGPDNIDLRLMERADDSTLGREHDGVLFTQEHLAAGLFFPVPTIFKQFLHFTRAPPALIHPNMIHILIGSCVLNHGLISRRWRFHYLLPEHRAGGSDVHVCFESLIPYCQWALLVRGP